MPHPGIDHHSRRTRVEDLSLRDGVTTTPVSIAPEKSAQLKAEHTLRNAREENSISLPESCQKRRSASLRGQCRS